MGAIEKALAEPKPEPVACPKPVLWSDPAYELTASLCRLPTVDDKDELIRRESVMDLVARWRFARDKMPTPYAAPIPEMTRDELRS
jgi:hypothetical protein